MLMCHTGEEPEIDEDEAIKKAVTSRFEQLNEAFLVALNAYVRAAEAQGDPLLHGKHVQSAAPLAQASVAENQDPAEFLQQHLLHRVILTCLPPFSAQAQIII